MIENHSIFQKKSPIFNRFQIKIVSSAQAHIKQPHVVNIEQAMAYFLVIETGRKKAWSIYIDFVIHASKLRYLFEVFAL